MLLKSRYQKLRQLEPNSLLYQCRDTLQNNIKTIQFFQIYSQYNWNTLSEELNTLKHSNLPKITDWFLDIHQTNTNKFQCVCVVLEKLQMNALEKFIGKLTQNQIFVIYQILKSLTNNFYVNKIVHKQITFSNISLDQNMNPILIDYGIFKYLIKSKSLRKETSNIQNEKSLLELKQLDMQGLRQIILKLSESTKPKCTKCEVTLQGFCDDFLCQQKSHVFCLNCQKIQPKHLFSHSSKKILYESFINGLTPQIIKLSNITILSKQSKLLPVLKNLLEETQQMQVDIGKLSSFAPYYFSYRWKMTQIVKRYLITIEDKAYYFEDKQEDKPQENLSRNEKQIQAIYRSKIDTFGIEDFIQFIMSSNPMQEIEKPDFLYCYR